MLDSHEEIRESVRRRLAEGLLRPVNGKAWGGPATGRHCLMCQRIILVPDIEYELDAERPVFVHLPCHNAWLEESRRLDQRETNLGPKGGHDGGRPGQC